jgi:hypothetical protein
MALGARWPGQANTLPSCPLVEWEARQEPNPGHKRPLDISEWGSLLSSGCWSQHRRVRGAVKVEALRGQRGLIPAGVLSGSMTCQLAPLHWGQKLRKQHDPGKCPGKVFHLGKTQRVTSGLLVRLQLGSSGL